MQENFLIYIIFAYLRYGEFIDNSKKSAQMKIPGEADRAEDFHLCIFKINLQTDLN